MNWIIRADEPFRGSALNHLKADGTVAYTDGLTLDQYAATKDFSIKLISDDEMDILQERYIDDLVTEPAIESEDDFDNALNCLPPSRWCRSRGIEMFHICERITGNLVSWHAKAGNRYYTFSDRDNVTSDYIAEKVMRAAAHEKAKA